MAGIDLLWGRSGRARLLRTVADPNGRFYSGARFDGNAPRHSQDWRHGLLC